MRSRPRLARALPLALALACAKTPDGGDTSATDTSATDTSASDASATDVSATDTSATDTSESDTSTTDTSTTEPLPPTCTATSQCAKGTYCLKKPCAADDPEPGCGEFRCSPQCSSPFDQTGFWTCADTQACCGMYPCEGGLCTEHFDPTS